MWAGPLELAMVMLMVSLELGVLPALAGVSATLLLIPLQVGGPQAMLHICLLDTLSCLQHLSYIQGLRLSCAHDPLGSRTG